MSYKRWFLRRLCCAGILLFGLPIILPLQAHALSNEKFKFIEYLQYTAPKSVWPPYDRINPSEFEVRENGKILYFLNGLAVSKVLYDGNVEGSHTELSASSWGSYPFKYPSAESVSQQYAQIDTGKPFHFAIDESGDFHLLGGNGTDTGGTVPGFFKYTSNYNYMDRFPLSPEQQGQRLPVVGKMAASPDGSVVYALTYAVNQSPVGVNLTHLYKTTYGTAVADEWKIANYPAFLSITVGADQSVYVGTAPLSMANDPLDYPLVSEEKFKISKYTPEGTLVSSFEVRTNYGKGEGFDYSPQPIALAVDSSGSVYALARITSKNRFFLQKYSPEGELLAESENEYAGQIMHYPGGVKIDGAGVIYVLMRTDNGDDVRVAKFKVSPGYVVSTTGDESDANISDGICDVDLNTEGEQCTLRAAIEEVNLSTDADTITFDIPTTDPGYNAGTSTFTISPEKPLPMVGKSLVVDGATQPVGKVVLNGSLAGEGSDGIYVSNGNLTLKNISISGFFGNGISNSVGDVRVENMDITDNGGYGIIADGDIYINSPASDIDTKKITVSGNGGKGDGGGIRSRNKSVTANNVEITNNQGPGILAKKDIRLKTVKSNNNKGPGIQSMDGNITIMSGNSYHSDDNEVSSNQGPGIISGVDVVIHGIGSGSTGIYEGGMIKIETDITVKGNAGWGIFSTKSVTLDRIDGVTSGVSPQASEISGNGDKTKQFYMTDVSGKLTLSLLNNVSFAGGIAGETVDASILEVTNNQGPGILARRDISLKTVKSNNNKGPGIQSMDGNITITSGKSDHSDDIEVNSNQGPGIFSGVDMTANVYGKSIFVQTDIQVKGNSGWGIGAPKRYVVVNGIDYGTPGKVSSSSSYIVGNGTQNSPFYMVEGDGTLVQLNYNIDSGGGILSGQMKGYLIEVTDNFGNGIQAGSDLTLSDSNICDNSGMNLVVGGTKNLTNVTVCTPVISPPVMGDVPNQSGAVGTAFSLNLAGYVTLTDGDITGYAIASGGLPSGLNLNTANGLIDGTPTTAGTYNVTVTASDNDGASNAAAIQFTVAAAPFNDTYTGPSPTGTGNITAGFSGGGAGCNFTVSQYIPVTGHAASPPAGSAPAGVSFPKGLFDFTTGGCTAGSTITMTITYPQALPAGTQYWKYGPTPTDASYHWYVLPATIAGNIVTFTIADGGLGDDDLTVNGIIVDQGGPGVPMAQATPTAIPTLSEWGMALLMCVLGLFGAGAVRRRSKVEM